MDVLFKEVLCAAAYIRGAVVMLSSLYVFKAVLASRKSRLKELFSINKSIAGCFKYSHLVVVFV